MHKETKSRIWMKFWMTLIVVYTLLIFSASWAQKIYVVNSVEDHEDVDLSDDHCADHLGRCTLRAALQNANKSLLRDEVYFDLPKDTMHFIILKKSLPNIIYPIVIDGRFQNQSDSSVVNIFLNGKNLMHEDVLPYFPIKGINAGLYLKSRGHHSIIRGIGFISFYSHAILIDTDGNTIQGNQFGFFDHDSEKENLTGITVHGNQNLVGGHAEADRNYFVYNFRGIGVMGSNNQIIGNYIGVKNDGITPAGNLIGIDSSPGSRDNQLSNNIISSNFIGADIAGSGFHLFKNKIGTDANGSKSLGNHVGIRLNSYCILTKIGAEGQGNLISGNEIGLLIRPLSWAQMDLNKFSDIEIKSNKIGTDQQGRYAIGNKKGIIAKNIGGMIIGGVNEKDGNLISGNLEAGIELVDVFDVIVHGNSIGTDFNQSYSIPNVFGIYLRDTDNQQITKNNILLQNLISGNLADGIYIGKGWSNLGIFSNTFGRRKNIAKELPNANKDIFLSSSNEQYCIGGDDTASQNIVNQLIAFQKADINSQYWWTELQKKNLILGNGEFWKGGDYQYLSVPPLLKIENLLYRDAINFFAFQLHNKSNINHYIRLGSQLIED